MDILLVSECEADDNKICESETYCSVKQEPETPRPEFPREDKTAGDEAACCVKTEPKYFQTPGEFFVYTHVINMSDN